MTLFELQQKCEIIHRMGYNFTYGGNLRRPKILRNDSGLIYDAPDIHIDIRGDTSLFEDKNVVELVEICFDEFYREYQSKAK